MPAAAEPSAFGFPDATSTPPPALTWIGPVNALLLPVRVRVPAPALTSRAPVAPPTAPLTVRSAPAPTVKT